MQNEQMNEEASGLHQTLKGENRDHPLSWS